MKLVDFEELMEMYNNKYQEFNVYDLRFLKDEYLPIVEAIPINWIHQYLNRQDETHNLPVQVELFTMDMIDKWRKESVED